MKYKKNLGSVLPSGRQTEPGNEFQQQTRKVKHPEARTATLKLLSEAILPEEGKVISPDISMTSKLFPARALGKEKVSSAEVCQKLRKIKPSSSKWP